MTDSDKDLKSLLLWGSKRRPKGRREQPSIQDTDADTPPRELFLAKLRAGSRRSAGTVFSHSGTPLQRNPRPNFLVTAGVFLCMLAFFASLSSWGNRILEYRAGEPQATRQETRLASTGEGYRAVGQWIDTVFTRRPEPRNVVLPEPKEDFVTAQIGSILREFGAEEYSVPEEFVREVNRFIQQYQERDHMLMVRALVDERSTMDRVREILRNNQMPEDFAYMALVESGLSESPTSQEGAAGFWQFTETTAREYGLEVEPDVDERLDVVKSTEAASRYLRDLILDFGSGSSVMLAMAAYNSGQEAVHRAVRSVKDPIKQRNFWHLYRTSALPAETREYVPKVFAAIIVGRNPQQFGF